MNENTNNTNDLVSHMISVKYISYEPRWKNFKPPLHWYTRWAYKIKEKNEYSNCHLDDINSNVIINQVQKGTNNARQIQIGCINNYSYKYNQNKEEYVGYEGSGNNYYKPKFRESNRKRKHR